MFLLFANKQKETKIMTIWELEKFINEYGGNIYSFCRKLCLDTDTAEELYQDVWLMAMQHIDEIEVGGNVKSYLISVAIGIWRNNKKKYAIRNRIVPQETIPERREEIVSEEESALNGILKREREEAVLREINALDDRYKIPVLLYYMQEQSVKEIAQLLSIPEGTVKRRLWTARKKLSIRLEEYI